MIKKQFRNFIKKSLLSTIKNIDYTNFTLALSNGISNGVDDVWLAYRQSILVGICLFTAIVFALLYLTIKLAMINCDCRESDEEDIIREIV